MSVCSEKKSRIKWLTYKGVWIRIEKHGIYSIVDIPNFLIMIRPRDEKNQILSIAAKLRLAKLHIDERQDQLDSPQDSVRYVKIKGKVEDL